MSESFNLDLRLYNKFKLPLITLEHCKDSIISRDELFNYCVYRFFEEFETLVYSKFNIDHKLTNFILKNRMRVKSHEVKEK